jgi:hypothetical protein
MRAWMVTLLVTSATEAGISSSARVGTAGHCMLARLCSAVGLDLIYFPNVTSLR